MSFGLLDLKSCDLEGMIFLGGRWCGCAGQGGGWEGGRDFCGRPRNSAVMREEDEEHPP
jgi:hypothetical protein